MKSSKRNVIRPLVIAMALALPGSAALAAQMDDVVTTRADQNIDQQYGRDSIYAFSPDSKPLKPEQSASRDFHPFAKMKSYAAEAWHKTTGVFKHPASTSMNAAQAESQPYASNSQDVVKTGEASSNRASDTQASDTQIGAQDVQPESQSMIGANGQPQSAAEELGLHVGSGYTADARSMEQSSASEGQGGSLTQYVLITPIDNGGSQLASDEDQASSEFVLIVPDSGDQGQSASSDELNAPAAD